MTKIVNDKNVRRLLLKDRFRSIGNSKYVVDVAWSVVQYAHLFFHTEVGGHINTNRSSGVLLCRDDALFGDNRRVASNGSRDG